MNIQMNTLMRVDVRFIFLLVVFAVAMTPCWCIERKLEISAETSTGNSRFIEGDRIEIIVTLKNLGETFEHRGDLKLFSDLFIDVLDDRHQKIPETRHAKRVRESLEYDTGYAARELKHLGEIKMKACISMLYDLSLAGSYTIELTYNLDKFKGSTVASKLPLKFEVVRESDQRETKELAVSLERRRAHKPLLGIEPTLRKYDPPSENAEHSINLGLGIDRFAVGTSPIRVEYKNKSGNDWLLVKPDVSESNTVHWQEKGNAPTQKINSPSAIFNVIGRNGSMQKSLLAPMQQKTIIKSGRSHAFVFNIFDISYDWHPGEYEMWIENEQEKINSNLITFKLEATLDSIGLLLDMAGIVPDSKDVLENHHQEVRRDFAINWLIKAFPDLPLNPITDRDAQNVVDAKNIQNRRFLDDFRAKWETRKSAPETLELIKKLNAPKAETVPGK